MGITDIRRRELRPWIAVKADDKPPSFLRSLRDRGKRLASASCQILLEVPLGSLCLLAGPNGMWNESIGKIRRSTVRKMHAFEVEAGPPGKSLVIQIVAESENRCEIFKILAAILNEQKSEKKARIEISNARRGFFFE
ncbi:hypothetical protein KM043_005321 [Ampulex compressa]|nr:hypothetical protein KM043_005321 [Ampulex compressa]